MDTPNATPARRFSPLIIIVVILVALGLWAASAYNGLVGARANVDTAWSQVETNYQRRFDLVPNLVSTVKGAANFEQETLTQVTEARTQFLASGSREEQIQSATEFESALSRLLVTVEAYPQLRATQAFSDLMAQLEGTENRIAVARRDYNEEVRDYNVKVRSFPGNIFASVFGFAPEEFFESQADADTAPQVDFTE